MHWYPNFFILLGICSSGFAADNPMTDIDMVNDSVTEELEAVEEPQVERIDPDIEEIANREYETVHGRILAVNMAHWEKKKKTAVRDQETINTTDTNVFGNIEKVNEEKPLHGLYQGDIVMDEELEELLNLPLQTRTKRNALRTRKRLWTSRVIPYQVPSYMSHIRANLLKAIAEIHKSTCIRFVPYRPGIHKTYIYITNDDGCAAKVGKRYASPGRQKLSLGMGCNFVGTIVHELLHAIGFFHEQSRSDRDKFVSIKWENILSGFSDQFDKYSWRTIDHLGKNYDYKSIMHYDRLAFTKNGKPTIVAVGNENMEFGRKDFKMSVLDIIEINALYDCQTTRYGWTKWSEFTPCDKRCYKSRERYCYNSGNRRQCGGNTNLYGIETDRRKCTRRECLSTNAIHGHWGRWSEWTKCSAACDGGLRTRFRRCDNPKPGKYGKPCNGKNKEKSPCTLGRCNPGIDDTDFDRPSRPFGMWRNRPSTKLRWTRHSGYTVTMDTGPSNDHTKGKGGGGYYMYVESSSPAKPGNKAILYSPTLTAKTEFQCLKFYYTMYGNTMGSLEVGMYQPGVPRKTLFYKRGNQGRDWHSAMATIQAKTTYSLEIVGTVGKTGYSDIAIDDVYIDDGKCSCQDKYINCIKWSTKGECKSNEVWMKKHCPRSCRVCGVSVCEDTEKTQCPLWAARGQCSKNKAYMHKNCAKSCKICKVSVCEDTDKIQCPLWAARGQCSKNRAYMHKNCAKSCKICKGVCEDSNKSQCPVWTKKGECTKNKQYMHIHCKKSCGICQGVSCKDDVRFKSKCPAWAARGECTKNKTWMHDKCAKSCKTC